MGGCSSGNRMEETLLSMHPVDEFGYVGVAFWHLLIPSNPILAKSTGRTTTSCTTPALAGFEPVGWQRSRDRVATREQVQIEISFPQHRPWVDLFLRWWEFGFRSFRRRAGINRAICFTCELGPKPYAITGRDGNDTTDRWAESLQMKTLVEDLYARIDAEPQDRVA